jgi:maltooligosyltrehalose synthase
LPRTLAGASLPVAAVWQTTELPLPEAAAERYRDALTGRIVSPVAREGRRLLPLSDALAQLPVAVLEPV